MTTAKELLKMSAMARGTHKLTLTRKGKVTLLVEGDDHCGVTDNGELRIEYRVEITCGVESLDARGFLVEQLGIHEFFERLPRTALSCELLAIDCAAKIARELEVENPDCKIRAMKVRIRPIMPFPKLNGSAWMTFEWSE